MQGPARPAGVAGADGRAGVDGVAGSTVKSKMGKKIGIKLKGKRPTLLATASSNAPPPGAPPGGAAVLNPIVETPAQLRAPKSTCNLRQGPCNIRHHPFNIPCRTLRGGWRLGLHR